MKDLWAVWVVVSGLLLVDGYELIRGKNWLQCAAGCLLVLTAISFLLMLALGVGE